MMDRNRLTMRLNMVLFAASFGVYSPVVTHGFLSFDDDIYVTDNPAVRRGLSDDSWPWTTFHASNWHPLTWLSHRLDCQLFGLDPRGHHLVNLLFHVTNTQLLFFLLWRMTGAAWRSALVAALFALHPLHVESVAWIAERKDVLSTFFGFLCLGAYALYAERPGSIRFAAVVAAFACSLLAKPMWVTLPFLLLLLDYWPLRRGQTVARLLIEKVPLLVLSAASSVVTVFAQSQRALVSSEHLPLPDRIDNALVSYARYLGKTFLPTNLTVFYPLHAGEPTTGWAVGAALLLTTVTILAVWCRRNQPAFLVGWLWFLGTLVPVIGLVQVGAQAMADRYTYIPLVGLFVALVWSIPGEWAGSTLGRTVCTMGGGILLIACAILTWQQLRFWQDDGTLWRHALDVDERNPVAHLSLGAHLYVRGKVDDAERNFGRALELSPRYALAVNNLGISRLRQGHVEDAQILFARTLELDPNNASFQNNLGLALLRGGRREQAIRFFGEAIRLAPTFAEPHFNLAVVLEDQEDKAGAATAMAEGMRLDPNWPRRASVLAAALLHSDNPKLRCPPEALLRARQACAATGSPDADMLAILSEAKTAVGDH